MEGWSDEGLQDSGTGIAYWENAIECLIPALHRYLRHRIADYRYDDHFGGVIYLFLRGVDAADPRSGIFSTRPDAELINKMDNLFAANTEEMA